MGNVAHSQCLRAVNSVLDALAREFVAGLSHAERVGILFSGVHAVQQVFLPGNAFAGLDGIAFEAKLLALGLVEYDALIAVDKSLKYQQNMATLPVAVILLDAVSNELHVLLRLVPDLKVALLALKPRTFVTIKAGA